MALSRGVSADLLLVLVTILAAAGWVSAREVLLSTPPLLFMGVRFSMAGGLLLMLSGSSLWLVTRPGMRLRILGLGAAMALAMLCWITGLHSGTPLGEGAFITSLGVILVPLMSWLLLKKTAERAVWFSLPVAVVGLAMLTLNGGFSVQPGQLWFLAAALLISFHFTLIGHFASQIPTLVLTASQLLIVGVIILIVSCLSEQWPSTVSNSTLGWFMVSTLIATCLRFTLQTRVQGMVDPARVAVIMVLEPVWVAVAGWAFYGERLSAGQLAGCGLILLAMLVARWQGIRGLFFRA